MLVKVVNLAAEIEEKYVAIAVENHKLVIDMNTVLEDCGKITKFAELLLGVTEYDLTTSYGNIKNLKPHKPDFHMSLVYAGLIALQNNLTTTQHNTTQ